MKDKKTRHTGVYRTPSGDWKIRATAVCRTTGKLKEATRTLPGTTPEPAVLSQLNQLKESLAEGGVRRSPKKSSALSVADFATEWLGRKAQRVRPSVAINYEAKLSLFILPRLGHIALEDLTREDIEGWVTWAETAKMKSGRAYTRATVTGWWRALVTLVKDAVAELGLPVDPTNRVRAPKPRQQGRREKGTLTADQLGSLLGELKRIAPERYAEVYILAYSGVRAGELYALSDEDVDEKRARILIRKSVWNGHLDSTKTDSPREVALTPGMLAVIREHRAFLEASFHRGRKGTLLFPAQTGGYRTGQTLRKPLARAAEAAGIEQVVTPQVLRRTVNTLLLLSGVDRIVIRSQLGHVSEQMTERYAGIGVDAKLDAVARMEARKRMVTATDVPL